MSDLGSYKRAQAARKALLNRGHRYWADDGTDAATAQHEAGHAIVALLLGLNPTSVTIEPDAGFGGMTRFDAVGARAFDLCVFAMAGSEAERLFGSIDDGAKNDLAQARALADDDTIESARIAARAILKANFAALTKLAVVLIDKRMLFGGEIEDIVAANPASSIIPILDADPVLNYGQDERSGDGMISLSEYMEARSDRRLVYYGE